MSSIPQIEEKISVEKAKFISPLSLAFVGDSVYSLYVRASLCVETDSKSGDLTKLTISMVCAEAQSKLMKEILPKLDEEELGVYKRARNAKIHNFPSHATISEYREATGFEALLGYLYLTGQNQRIKELLGENNAD